MAGGRLFDTHAHLVSDDWDKYPPRALRADLPVPERAGFTVTIEALIEMMDANHVARACVVQRGHLYGYDNSYIIDSAHRYRDRVRPVVILDPQDPQSPAIYRKMVAEQHVCGYRMAQARAHLLDTAWMSSPGALEIWKACASLGTPMNLIVFRNQLPYVLPLIKIIAQQFPTLPIVLDHGGMPFGMSQYEVALAQRAGEDIVMPGAPHFGIDTTIAIFEDVPNVYFKITEINMERLVVAEIRPAHLVRRMIDSFGPERLIWGSDVGQSVRWSYEDKVRMAHAATDWLTATERQNFLYDNAARIYASAGE